MSVGRQLAFISRIPPRKIVRRLGLDLKRRVLSRVAPRRLPAVGLPEAVATPPLPIMPPRAGRITAVPGGARFTFLNRTRELAFPISWSVAAGDRREQLWSMNLHYMEYLEEADDALFAALADDWLRGNRPYGPGYWRDVWNSYALSLRVVVWMQQLAARPWFAPDLRARMADSIAGQLLFLERNLETDLGGNHLVKNIKALLWGAAFFRGAAADRWRRKGLALLASAIGEQILPDGMHDERSPSYHAQVFVDLLECRAALGGDPLAGRLDAALARMAQAVADLAHPDGLPAQFNDGGLWASYPPGICLAAYASVTGATAEPRPSFAYADAGYFGFRSERDCFIADCGPIAPDALPAHGHADVLSFEWSVAGQRVFVDQGVFEYVAGDRRTASRSVASHNVLSIEGMDQAEFFGDFRVGRRPEARVMAYEPVDGGFMLEGAHDGFRRTAGGPLHVRRFEVAADRIVIRDRLEGAVPSGVRQGALLHPDMRVEVGGTVARLSTGDCTIELTADTPLAAVPAVWWPDFGIEVPTTRLVAAWPGGLAEAVWRLDVVYRRKPRGGA